MTRQQRYLGQALEHIRGLQSQSPETQRMYGRLCHLLPILVRVNGLCQAVAFVEERAIGEGSRPMAYRALHDHLRVALEAETGHPIAIRDLASAVGEAPLGEYMRYTRTVLAAWVYYKRFATSLLAVSGDEAEEPAV